MGLDWRACRRRRRSTRVSDFQERYCGEYASFQAYADEQIDALGVLAGVDDEIARYFDAAAYAADLAHSYTVVDAPDGVYIFRDL